MNSGTRIIINTSINFLLNLVIRKLSFHWNLQDWPIIAGTISGKTSQPPSHNTSQTALNTPGGIYQDINDKSLQMELQEKARPRGMLGSCRPYFILFYSGSSLGLSSVILLVLIKYHPISRKNPVPHHLSYIKLHFQLRSSSHGDLARLVPDRRGSP